VYRPGPRKRSATLVLDVGAGLQQLSSELDGVPFRGSLLLSHLHWDHTHGMPFFRGGMLDGHRVDVYLPEQGADPEELLERAISPPHFPIRPKQLGSGWTFRILKPGHYQIEGFSVQAAEIPHKGGRTFGYRVERRFFGDRLPAGPQPAGARAGSGRRGRIPSGGCPARQRCWLSHPRCSAHRRRTAPARLPRSFRRRVRGGARTAVPGRHAGAVPP
jgi:Beta-lactamase superfamily domain